MNVNFKLNKFQRTMLLLGAGLILAFTFVQGNELGFDAVSWLPAIVVSSIMAVLATSGLNTSKKNKKSLNSIAQGGAEKETENWILKKITPSDTKDLGMASMAAFHAVSKALPKKATQFSGAQLPNIDTSNYTSVEIENDTENRAWVYSSTLVLVAARTLDTDFFKSDSFSSYFNLWTHLEKRHWLERFGLELDDFPNQEAKSKFQKLSLDTSVIRADAAHDKDKDGYPFEQLYRFLDQDDVAPVENLYLKYGRLTERILGVLTGQLPEIKINASQE